MAAAIRAGVREAIEVKTPDVKSGKGFFLKCAHLMQFSVGFAQKFCNFQKGKVISTIGGEIIDIVAGDNKKVQKFAAMILGAKAIAQCSSDLLKLKWLGQRLSNLFKGKCYVMVRQDYWDLRAMKGRISPSIQDKWRWFWIVFMEQLKQIFITIGQIFKRLFILALHLSDAYKAYSGNCVKGIIINSKALWDEVSSDNSALVKHWKKKAHINKWLLKQQRLGKVAKGTMSAWKVFKSELKLAPNFIRKIPRTVRDWWATLKNKFLKFVKKIERIGNRMKKRISDALINTNLIYKIPRALVPSWKAEVVPFEKNDKGRFMEPPRRRVAI